MARASIMVEGNLGRDPEMRYTPSGRPVTQFSVAVSNSKRQGDEWVDDGTDWYRVSVWGDAAERAAEQLAKGHRVVVTGRFRTREWESEKTGSSGISLEINADWFKSFGKREGDESGGGFGSAGIQRPAAVPAGGAPSDDDLDDLPF
jgi:single-strand DNA-binding protein